METPVVDKIYLLEKFPGKGGWTFARIPEIKPDINAPFGWVKVSGTIDKYNFGILRLMPMGNGELFFSVNSVVRKAIKKQDGDTVHLILYRVADIQTIPDEVFDCLKEDPAALGAFNLWTESKKLEFVRYVYDAKTETQKAERLVELLERLHQSY